MRTQQKDAILLEQCGHGDMVQLANGLVCLVVTAASHFQVPDDDDRYLIPLPGETENTCSASDMKDDARDGCGEGRILKNFGRFSVTVTPKAKIKHINQYWPKGGGYPVAAGRVREIDADQLAALEATCDIEVLNTYDMVRLEVALPDISTVTEQKLDEIVHIGKPKAAASSKPKAAAKSKTKAAGK